jgi:putative salt-induced outer membrane protein YdiY
MWNFTSRMVCISLLFSPSLYAQAVPESAVKDAKATKGQTDLTTDKAIGLERVDEKDAKNATELSLSAGALQTTGNSRLLALTTTSNFRLRRKKDQMKAAAAINYGRSAPDNDSPAETTVENYQLIARYERFFGDWTLFFAGQGRRDRFLGLNLRARLDPGVGYYFLNTKKEQFWVEAGYDLNYDNRQDASRGVLNDDKTPKLDAAGNQIILDKSQLVHSTRLFIGAEVALKTGFKLTTGVEYMQGFSDSSIYRVNTYLQANAAIQDSLALSVALTERYDSAPLPGKKTLDTITSVSLVFTVF